MGMNEMFAKFNEMVDVAGLQKDVETAASNDGDFVEVPYGDYEVKVSKIELGATGEKSKTPGAPMAKVWFDIIAGDLKGQKIFMNQMLTSGFGVHKMNQLLDSLETGVTVVFEGFEQYADLFKQIFDLVDGKAEYQLHYDVNNKGYSIYEIIQRYPDKN
jgi:hypothetical protein